MALYIITSDLGPTFGLRVPFVGEDFTNKPTIELSLAEFDEWIKAADEFDKWQNRLGEINGT